MRKIQVIGGGLSGLAVAYFCQKLGLGQVYLYEKSCPQGASRAGAGLLHPFVGAKALLSKRGLEGMEATRALIEEVEAGEALLGKGVYRVAFGGIQKTMMERWCKRLPEEVERVDRIPNAPRELISKGQGLYYIKRGLSIDMQLYLVALKEAFQKLGGCCIKRTVVEGSFEPGGIVIHASGYGIKDFEAVKSLGVSFVKGQLLMAKRPKRFEKCPPILGKGYLSLGPDNTLALGASYEREFTTSSPDEVSAKEAVLERVEKFIKLEEPLHIHEVKAGVRVVNNEHYFPIAKKLKKGEYVIAAMGSRGLLYHALLAKELAELIAKEVN